MRANKNQKTIEFVSFIIEMYKRKYNLNGKETVAVFNRHQIQDWLYDNYDSLHTVGAEYVLQEIQDIIKADNHGG